MTAVYTDDPALVAGCADCLELVAEYLGDDNEHWAQCPPWRPLQQGAVLQRAGPSEHWARYSGADPPWRPVAGPRGKSAQGPAF